MVTEIVYRWPDGREEVRYRRPAGSADANRYAAEVAMLQAKQGPDCPYFVREVSSRDCNCRGWCGGKEGLGAGWHCVLENH